MIDHPYRDRNNPQLSHPAQPHGAMEGWIRLATALIIGGLGGYIGWTLMRGDWAMEEPRNDAGLTPYAVGAGQGDQTGDDSHLGDLPGRLHVPPGFGNGGKDDAGVYTDPQGRPYRRWRDCYGDPRGRHRCGRWNYGPAPGDDYAAGPDKARTLGRWEALTWRPDAGTAAVRQAPLPSPSPATVNRPRASRWRTDGRPSSTPSGCCWNTASCAPVTG